MDKAGGRKPPPPVIERAGKRFADDMAMAGIEYAAVFVCRGKLQGVHYTDSDGRIMTAVPVNGAWFEYVAEIGGSRCQFI